VPAFLGSVPAEAPATEHAASVIGQGKVLASPLGMATVAASVASGRTVGPHLVEGAGGDASAPGSLTEAEAQDLAGLMRW
jgi:cell division protein FtsI/penicillin-binding protein 2